MAIEKATYSNSAIHEAVKMTKELNLTVARKNQHFAKASELRKVFEYCADNINELLFDPNYWYMKDYFRAAYDYKQYTKKELDKMQRAAIRYLQNELTAIHAMMLSGEVNTTD